MLSSWSRKRTGPVDPQCDVVCWVCQLGAKERQALTPCMQVSGRSLRCCGVCCIIMHMMFLSCAAQMAVSVVPRLCKLPTVCLLGRSQVVPYSKTLALTGGLVVCSPTAPGGQPWSVTGWDQNKQPSVSAGNRSFRTHTSSQRCNTSARTANRQTQAGGRVGVPLLHLSQTWGGTGKGGGHASSQTLSLITLELVRSGVTLVVAPVVWEAHGTGPGTRQVKEGGGKVGIYWRAPSLVLPPPPPSLTLRPPHTLAHIAFRLSIAAWLKLQRDSTAL